MAKAKKEAEFRIERDPEIKKGLLCNCGNDMWQNITIVIEGKSRRNSRTMMLECTNCKRRVTVGSIIGTPGVEHEEKAKKTS